MDLYFIKVYIVTVLPPAVVAGDVPGVASIKTQHKKQNFIALPSMGNGNLHIKNFL